MKHPFTSVELTKIGDRVFFSSDQAKLFMEYKDKLTDLLSYNYYTVRCNPDLTEGRGYHNEIIVGVPNSPDKNLLMQFLMMKLGFPIVYIMGRVPTDNWSIGNRIKCRNETALSNYFNTIVECRGEKVLREVFHLDEHGIPLEGVDLVVR